MIDDKPRAYTADEMRKMVLDHLKAMASYWARIPIKTDEDRAYVEKCGGEAQWRTEGVLFSFLCLLDGVTGLPAFDLIPSPHPDDEAYHREQGENWWAPVVINECHLHDQGHGKQESEEPGLYTASFHSVDGIGDQLWVVRGPRRSLSIRTNDGAMADRIALLLNLTER